MKRVLRDSFHIERAPLELGFAVRCTIGVAIPLAVSLLYGHGSWGIAAAVGALSVGFASRQGVYRTRAAAMMLTAAGMAFSTFAGAVAGANPFAIAGVGAAWGFAYGLVSSLGQAATIVGQNSVIALVIFSAYSFTPAQAAVQALLLFGGGLFQMLLLVVIWPLQRFAAERRALAAVYRSLAHYARKLPDAALEPPGVVLFQKAQAVLSDPQPFTHRSDRAYYWNLYSEAERIREQLGVIATRRIAASGTAEILDEIAAALEAGNAAREQTHAFEAIERYRRTVANDPELDRSVQRLAGQLRSALHVAQSPDDAAVTDALRRQRILSRRNLYDAAMTIRGNLRPGSPYFQHAVRLAVVLFLASLGERLLHLERGYWAPMTALLVLRPDFSTTFSRGVQRLVGTLAGAVLATVMIAVLHPSPAVSVAFVVLFAFLGYLVIALNYAVYTITVTAYVVFLLSLVGYPSHTAVVDRISATLFGGALALLCYAVFPTWERNRVPAALAKLIESQGRYVAKILAMYAGAAPFENGVLNRLQSEVWENRIAADASVERMFAEPVTPRAIDARTAQRIIAAHRRLGLAALSIRAGVEQNAGRYPALEPLAVQVREATQRLAAAIREHARPEAIPPLRQTQQALAEDIPIVHDTDLAVDAINTISDLLAARTV